MQRGPQIKFNLENFIIFLNRTTTTLEIEDYENLKTTFFRTTLAKGEPIIAKKKTVNEKKKGKKMAFTAYKFTQLL